MAWGVLLKLPRRSGSNLFGGIWGHPTQKEHGEFPVRKPGSSESAFPSVARLAPIPCPALCSTHCIISNIDETSEIDLKLAFALALSQ